MTQSFAVYTGIVEYLVKNLQRPLDIAIREAGVPNYMIEQMMAYMTGPVEILRPDLILGQQQVPLCAPIADDAPQPYFAAFRDFLLSQRKWDRSTVETLAETSNELVARLPEPSGAKEFQTRGLVVGHIQSGKTANMAALIARAADQGYKLCIILGGLWNDLRAQTQRRMDQEITGHSDAGAIDGPFVTPDPAAPPWSRLTNAGLAGEFNPGTHNDLNPQTPKLAVIKKRVTVLRRFTDFLRRANVRLEDLPALIIDDEADQASINTNYGKMVDGEEVDPSKTNARIRDLLAVLPKSVYVAFTATPYANVLIDAEVEEDLYPRDFIATLPEPRNYFGPRQLFGIGMRPSDLSVEEASEPALDIIRYIPEDQLDALEELGPGDECPPVLSDALLAFLLSSCARLARGQEDKHFTMFVHPSQRTEDHAAFRAAVEAEMETFAVQAGRPRNFPEFTKRAKEMWESDFVPIIMSYGDNPQPAPDFETIWKFAKTVTDGIEFKTLNYNSTDELDYTLPAKRYIVFGGNRLSRGLTLEGLSVSFFTRNATTYDTLLQMGRWFGFRPGYADLTAIYVEQAMANQFADLARVELELRADLAKYARKPHPPTPLELMPKIRSHPALAVTPRNKMGAATVVRISFQNGESETVTFPLNDRAVLRNNQQAARTFVRGLEAPSSSVTTEGMHVWRDVPAARVLDFLDSYTFGAAPVVNRPNLTKYIRRQNARGELVLWDIVIPRGSGATEPFYWSDDVIARKVERSAFKEQSIKVLRSPGDILEWRRLGGRSADDSTRAGIFLYAVDRSSGVDKNKPLFPNGDGEDVIGLVFSFPDSRSNATVEYVSQQDQ
jgi:hypothetical protein